MSIAETPSRAHDVEDFCQFLTDRYGTPEKAFERMSAHSGTKQVSCHQFQEVVYAEAQYCSQTDAGRLFRRLARGKPGKPPTGLMSWRDFCANTGYKGRVAWSQPQLQHKSQQQLQLHPQTQTLERTPEQQMHLWDVLEQEQELREQQQLEQQLLEQQRLEQQRLEQQQFEKQQLQNWRLEEQQLYQQQHHQHLEQQLLEQQQLEQQRFAQQQLDQLQLEQQQEQQLGQRTTGEAASLTGADKRETLKFLEEARGRLQELQAKLGGQADAEVVNTAQLELQQLQQSPGQWLTTIEAAYFAQLPGSIHPTQQATQSVEMVDPTAQEHCIADAGQRLVNSDAAPHEEDIETDRFAEDALNVKLRLWKLMDEARANLEDADEDPDAGSADAAVRGQVEVGTEVAVQTDLVADVQCMEEQTDSEVMQSKSFWEGLTECFAERGLYS